MTAYAAGHRAMAGLRALLDAIMSAQRVARTSNHTDSSTAPPHDATRPAARPSPRPRRTPSDPLTPARPSPRPRPAPAGDSQEPKAPDDSQGAGSTTDPGTAGPAPRPSPRPRPAPGRRPSPRPQADPAEDSFALVRRAQQGDADAFGELYDRYFDLVFRYIYYRIGDRSQAEDFTSETFLRALRRISSFTWTGRDIGAWFVTIARNIILDHVKSSRYRLEISTPDMLDADRVEEGPENAVLDVMTSAELMRCVGQLNPEQQECIVLRFLQGLSVAETAAIMGKNDGAIKALQHRAVRRLATLLPEGLR